MDFVGLEANAFRKTGEISVSVVQFWFTEGWCANQQLTFGLMPHHPVMSQTGKNGVLKTSSAQTAVLLHHFLPVGILPVCHMGHLWLCLTAGWFRVGFFSPALLSYSV